MRETVSLDDRHEVSSGGGPRTERVLLVFGTRMLSKRSRDSNRPGANSWVQCSGRKAWSSLRGLTIVRGVGAGPDKVTNWFFPPARSPGIYSESHLPGALNVHLGISTHWSYWVSVV